MKRMARTGGIKDVLGAEADVATPEVIDLISSPMDQDAERTVNDNESTVKSTSNVHGLETENGESIKDSTKAANFNLEDLRERAVGSLVKNSITGLVGWPRSKVDTKLRTRAEDYDGSS